MGHELYVLDSTGAVYIELQMLTLNVSKFEIDNLTDHISSVGRCHCHKCFAVGTALNCSICMQRIVKNLRYLNMLTLAK